jgi:hypothetical protein
VDALLKETLWKQFGAAIDMLENAIRACPVEYWGDAGQFWYISYHTLFYLDYYLSEDPTRFKPPAPFTLSELDPSGPMPERVYAKEELLSYLEFSRAKCHDLIDCLTNESMVKRWINEYRNYNVVETILYNMRHVQHHTGQLNLLLRQRINDAPGWVSQTNISF